VRLFHDGRALVGRVDVCDRYVRSVVTEHDGPVCADSCVGFFVLPREGFGQFDFEFNTGGAGRRAELSSAAVFRGARVRARREVGTNAPGMRARSLEGGDNQ
jgi:hypothetical protein